MVVPDPKTSLLAGGGGLKVAVDKVGHVIVIRVVVL